MKIDKIVFLLSVLIFNAIPSYSKITLPSLFTDHMVLQRNTTIRLWGQSTGEKVSVTSSWDGKKYRSSVDKDGCWSVLLNTSEAGGPYRISITDGEETVLNDVLIGEVWVCSGQSNMEMPNKGFNYQPVNGASETLLDAMNYPRLRLLTVKWNSKEQLQDDCPTTGWLASTPGTVGDFSAAAYHFGRNLSQVLGIPIGLISTSWGGSAIEAWMDTATLKSIKDVDLDICFNRTAQHHKISYLFNGMINPIKDYAAKGFIWYQGETNISQHEYYDKMMVEMVRLWRNSWNNPQMPFYYVQLAHYKYNYSDSISLPLTIEAQCRALKDIPLSGMASTTDIGHETCIHPGNKIEVGQRLAFLALSKDYGVTGLPNDAPTYRSVEFEGDKAIVLLNNVDKNGNSIACVDPQGKIVHKGFEIAGNDRKFHPANSYWDHKKQGFVVYTESVSQPVAVRYGFRNYIATNVKTVFGQPLVPFRTDDW